jgi:galactokinase
MGIEPRWTWIVPGRIEVFGKHTDYAGGRSLLAAVPRGFVFAAAPRDDGIVAVSDAVTGEIAVIDPSDPDSRFGGWRSYAHVVARRLAGNFPDAELGADIAFASDLPIAAGLSSSSALVVGIAAALIQRASLREHAVFRDAIKDTLDLAGYLGAVENGLAFGNLVHTSGVGTHGGSEDHTAILACRAGTVSAYSYVPVRHEGDATFPDEWRFVVATSGVAADKAGTVMEHYNRASLATRELVTVWNRESSGAAASTLAEVVAAGGAGELSQLIPAGKSGSFDRAYLIRRLVHFVTEDARVPMALRAFAERDAGALADLAHGSQLDADRLLGNQIPETNALASLAIACGAFASSSFGAGFGGSVWALVPREEALPFGERWIETYRARHPWSVRCEWFIASPGPGLIFLPG